LPCRAFQNQLDFNIGRGYPRSSIDIGGGGAEQKAGSRGIMYSGDILHQMGRQIYLGLGVTYFRSRDDVSYTTLTSIQSTNASKRVGYMILSRADLPHSGAIIPYVLGGIGVVRNSLEAAGVPVAGSAWSDTGTTEPRVFIHSTKYTFGYTTGFGMDLMLTNALSIGAQVRYEGAYKQNFDVTDEGRRSGFNGYQGTLTDYTLGLSASLRY